MEFGASLTHNDVAWYHFLSAKLFDTETSTCWITTIAWWPTRFLGCPSNLVWHYKKEVDSRVSYSNGNGVRLGGVKSSEHVTWHTKRRLIEVEVHRACGRRPLAHPYSASQRTIQHGHCKLWERGRGKEEKENYRACLSVFSTPSQSQAAVFEMIIHAFFTIPANFKKVALMEADKKRKKLMLWFFSFLSISFNNGV